MDRAKRDARAQQLPAAGQDPTAQHQHLRAQHQHQCSDLPEAVLTAILQHVHLRYRLSSCALVCKSWAAAVASTTAEAAAFLTEPDHFRHLQDWLQLWGERVSSIDLYSTLEGSDSDSDENEDDDEDANPVQCSLLLPCSQLTRLTSLHLSCCPVNFQTQQDASEVSTCSTQRSSTAQTLAAAASSSSCEGGSAAMPRMRLLGPPAAGAAVAGSPAAFLPALRELYLSKAKVQHEGFLQLSQATAITSLRLRTLTLCTAAWAPVAEQQTSTAFAAVLQGLQGLEILEVEGFVLQDPAAALAPLSTMQRLQRLSLTSYSCNTAALAHLPTSITSLELHGYEDDYSDGISFLSVTTSSLKQLPLLADANLTWLNLGPEVLTSWSRLTQLSVRDLLLEPAGDEFDHGDFRDMTHTLQLAFLAELGKLTQLQDLSLYDMDLNDVLSDQSFTALTASSQLQHLRVSQRGRGQVYDTTPLPRGALQHMFSLSKRWPSLQTLRLEVWGPEIHGDDEDWCVDEFDIERLAVCLPALGSLSLMHVVQDIDTVSALTQLMPGLIHLEVAGDEFEDEAAGVVAQLTSLVELDWSHSEITLSGLQQLTALRKLESLHVDECPHVKELERILDPEGLDELDNGFWLDTSPEATAAGTHDVWQQLQELCSYAAAVESQPSPT